MKILAFLMLISSSALSFAQEFDYAEALTLLAQGPTYSHCPLFKVPKINYALSPAFKEHKADCSKFINSKGELGVHGKEIFSHMDQISNSQYYAKTFPGMNDICPGWVNFGKTAKKYFWVWFFAGIAWKEATCKENQINTNATSGIAVGYLQLNEKQSARSWRGDDSGKTCSKPEVKTAANNLKCGMEIFNEQLQGKAGIYKGNGQLGGKGSSSYWQDLRGSGSKVLQMMKAFPGCNPKT